MKRVACALFVFLCLAGCSKTTKPAPKSYALPLCGTVQISTELLDMSAEWTYTSDGMVFTLTSPQTVQGAVVTCGAEKTVTVEGLSVPLAQTACFNALEKAWRVFLRTQTEPVETPEGWRSDFTSTDGFSVLQSADGSVLRFLLSEPKTQAVFALTSERIP